MRSPGDCQHGGNPDRQRISRAPEVPLGRSRIGHRRCLRRDRVRRARALRKKGMAYMGDVFANTQLMLAFRPPGRRRRLAHGLRSHEEQPDVPGTGRLAGGNGGAHAARPIARSGSWLDGLVRPGDILLPLERAFFNRLQSQIGTLDEEVLLIVYLDRAGALIGDELVAGGTICSHGIGYRRLFENAFRRGAAALVLAHNHPSGSAEPSAEDIASTRALRALAVPMQTELIDHLIVGADAVFSMRAAGFVGR